MTRVCAIKGTSFAFCVDDAKTSADSGWAIICTCRFAKVSGLQRHPGLVAKIHKKKGAEFSEQRVH